MSNLAVAVNSSKIFSFLNVNLGSDYHYYGLKWSPDSLCFFFDGKEIRSVHNDYCFSSAPIYLSEAIITWAGEVTDAIDGTQMEIDYVRVYNEILPSDKTNFINNDEFEIDKTTTDSKRFKKRYINTIRHR